LLSKTAVSQLGERLWEDYQAFTQRDLSDYEIKYLFVDGIAERLRPGAKREPVWRLGVLPLRAVVCCRT
jgi:transposase-like protein